MRSPLEYREIRSIWDASIAEERTTITNAENIERRLKEMREEEGKIDETIEVIKAL